jgi:hypothetical protein
VSGDLWAAAAGQSKEPTTPTSLYFAKGDGLEAAMLPHKHSPPCSTTVLEQLLGEVLLCPAPCQPKQAAVIGREASTCVKVKKRAIRASTTKTDAINRLGRGKSFATCLGDADVP